MFLSPDITFIKKERFLDTKKTGNVAFDHFSDKKWEKKEKSHFQTAVNILLKYSLSLPGPELLTLLFYVYISYIYIKDI